MLRAAALSVCVLISCAVGNEETMFAGLASFDSMPSLSDALAVLTSLQRDESLLPSTCLLRRLEKEVADSYKPAEAVLHSFLRAAPLLASIGTFSWARRVLGRGAEVVALRQILLDKLALESATVFEELRGMLLLEAGDCPAAAEQLRFLEGDATTQTALEFAQACADAQRIQSLVVNKLKTGKCVAQGCLSTVGLASPYFNAIPRYSEINSSQFEAHVQSRRSLIARGVVSKLYGESVSSWDWWTRHCGHVPIGKLYRHSAGSLGWAEMEAVPGPPSLQEHIKSVLSGSSGLGVFDASLSRCSKASAVLRPWPLAAERDAFKAAVRRGLLRASEDPFAGHPSLFLQPGGTHCGLHVDRLDSEFWQAVLLGRKLWRLYPMPEETQRVVLGRFDTMSVDVAPIWNGQLNATNLQHLPYAQLRALEVSYSIDYQEKMAFEPPSSLASLRKELEVSAVIEAGDFIYVPGGTPHVVENLEPVVAIAMNYVDVSRASAAAAELEKDGIRLQLAARQSVALKALLKSGSLEAQGYHPHAVLIAFCSLMVAVLVWYSCFSTKASRGKLQ